MTGWRFSTYKWMRDTRESEGQPMNEMLVILMLLLIVLFKIFQK